MGYLTVRGDGKAQCREVRDENEKRSPKASFNGQVF